MCTIQIFFPCPLDSKLPAPPPPPARYGSNLGSVRRSTDDRVPPMLFDMTAQSHALPPTIESFARSQTFEGSFDGSPALYLLLVKQSNPPSRPDILAGASDLANKIWCTLLCVAYLEIKLTDERDVWGIMVEKAMLWVEEILESLLGADNLVVKTKALKEYAKNCIA